MSRPAIDLQTQAPRNLHEIESAIESAIAETTVPLCEGERMDDGIAVDGLLQLE